MILRKQNWFSVSKFDSQWANLFSKYLLTINLLIVSKFCEQFSWAVSNFVADVSSKIITLANPVLSQPDMEQKWFLLRPARIFPHSRFTTYCRTFQELSSECTEYLIHYLELVCTCHRTVAQVSRESCNATPYLAVVLVHGGWGNPVAHKFFLITVRELAFFWDAASLDVESSNWVFFIPQAQTVCHCSLNWYDAVIHSRSFTPRTVP